jgi:hypothetical protein
MLIKEIPMTLPLSTVCVRLHPWLTDEASAGCCELSEVFS